MASSRPTSAEAGPALGLVDRRPGREGRIVLEDTALEGAELGGRLEAELVQGRAASRYAARASAWRPAR